jgi:hypothetical protein
MKRKGTWFLAGAISAASVVLGGARPALAHCDTLDGPVVASARAAFAKGEVTPVLKWVRPQDEGEIHSAFASVLKVRAQGSEARQLADTWFFETLVRLHRAGEGAPYTGLKAAGAELGPAVEGADRALETGSVDALVKLVTDDAAASIRERFKHAYGARKHAEDSVAAGRAYVAAYVEYVHFVERLHVDATEPAGHGSGDEPTPHSGHGKEAP